MHGIPFWLFISMIAWRKKLSLRRLVRDRMLRRRLPEDSREQSVGRVAGVFDNPPGFPYTPPGVDVLEGGKLTSNNVAGSSHDPLQSCSLYQLIFIFYENMFPLWHKKIKKGNRNSDFIFNPEPETSFHKEIGINLQFWELWYIM